MIQGHTIENLINLFESRGVSLFHACQFLDLQSYLSLGGIPSRSHLESSGKPFTSFETDSQDHTNSVWDKVFVNLSDFGNTFAKGGKSVPNPYGPILLQLRPSAFREAEDVAICLRSAGGRDFNRDQEALDSLESIDNLFAYPTAAGYPLSTYVKFRKTLREDFHNPEAADPEISCTVRSGRLSLQYVDRILIDPYKISGKLLSEWVQELVTQINLRFTIGVRPSSRTRLYNELANVIAKVVPTCRDLSLSQHLSQELREWAQEIQGLEYQYRRFANYLREGTLLQLL